MTPSNESLPPIVVDTNVVSYIYRGLPIARPYLERIVGHRPTISFQTYEELRHGVLRNNWGQRRIEELFQYVDREYDVVHSNSELVATCADLRLHCERQGRRLETADAWIAATAVMLDCSLLSHDRDFSVLKDQLEVFSFV